MVSEIQYGGRITDDFDQLLMDTYAEKYFHQEVTRPNFELYKDERAGISYKIPDSSEIEGFRKVCNLSETQKATAIAFASTHAEMLESCCACHYLVYA